MKVSYYYNGTPNKYATDFCKHLLDVEFVHNTCDKDVDFIYCGSPDAITCLKHAVDAKGRYKKKLICYVWDIPYNVSGLQGVAIQNINMLRLCDGVISACKNTQQILRKQFRIESIQLYFYVPDLEMIKSMPSVDKVNQIIQVGRFVPHKQHEIAINAIWNTADIELVCVGTGNRDEEYFKGLIENNGGNVRILNNIDRKELLNEIKRSRLLISGSNYEGFGLPPIEALYLDTPIILYDMPVFREIYKDDIPYFTCSAHLYDHLEDFFDNNEKIEYATEMLKMAKPHVESFTPEKFAERWYGRCTELLRNIK